MHWRNAVKRQLTFVKDNWGIFPLKTFYQTSCLPVLNLDPNTSVYVYSLHCINNPKFEEVPLGLKCFSVFKFKLLGVSQEIGYCFVPTLPDSYIIRYTPIMIAATSPKVTKKALENSDKKVVLGSRHFDVAQFSCGAEVVTDLTVKLGVTL